MVKVAIAGGTGNVGRHITDSILATKRHTVVALSRSSSNSTLEALGVKVVAVDYTDHASLVAALTGVHTVISTISPLAETQVALQLALLAAAVEAGVKRFAPSEFGGQVLPDDPILLYQFKASVAEAVAKSGLEWTIFENGVFMNYLASGTAGLGYLRPFNFVIDVEKGTATVPGTGEQKVCFTTAEDVGAFVAATLDLEKWPEESRMVGDTKSYNEVIALAEKVRGRKFKVTYESEEDLRKSMDPNAPPSIMSNLLQKLKLAIIGEKRFFFEGNLNTLCPQVKPVGVEGFLRKWWS